jgi:hypothetical protein
MTNKINNDDNFNVNMHVSHQDQVIDLPLASERQYLVDSYMRYTIKAH